MIVNLQIYFRLTFTRFASYIQLILCTKISFKTEVINRKYSDNYIQFGFSFIENNDSPHLQCVIWREVLANISQKPFLVAYHLEQQLYVFKKST